MKDNSFTASIIKMCTKSQFSLKKDSEKGTQDNRKRDKTKREGGERH